MTTELTHATAATALWDAIDRDEVLDRLTLADVAALGIVRESLRHDNIDDARERFATLSPAARAAVPADVVEFMSSSKQ